MKRVCKVLVSLLGIIALLACITTGAFAHSGRTDSSGGHRDNKNKSGLGSYHYHCGGYPAHLHTNGYCPYRDVFPTKVSLSAEKTSLGIGESCSISATVSPSNACSTNVSWESSDSNVVKIENGTIKAVGFGTATISATTFNSKKGSVKITVKEITADSITITGFEDSAPLMYIGDVITAGAVLTPENVDNPAITWTSSDETVASVDGGKIQALQVGTTTITAISSNGKTDSVEITVEEIVAEKIEIKAPDPITIEDRGDFTVAFYPEDTTDKTIAWKSSDESILTVGEDGSFEAVGVGSVKVDAVQKDVQTAITVEVLPINVETVSIVTETEFDGKMKPDEEIQLIAEVYPENATYRDITWETSDPEVVAVDENGVIRAVSSGEATVYARSGDGAEAEIQIKVASPIGSTITGVAGIAVVALGVKAIKKRKGSKEDN